MLFRVSGVSEVKLQTTAQYKFENSLVASPISKIAELQRKVINNQSVLNEFSETLQRIHNDLTKAYQIIPKPLHTELNQLIQRINTGLKDGLNIKELVNIAAEYSVFMDLKVAGDPATWSYIKRANPRISKVNYFYERRENAFNFLKETFDKIEIKNGVGSVIPVPSFKELSFKDMLISADVAWLGLTNELTYFDGTRSPPSDFFTHDVNHNNGILATRYSTARSSLYEPTELSSTKQGFIISKAIENQISDPILKEGVYILLFDLYHEEYLPLDVDFLKVHLADTMRKKDGAYYSSVRPGVFFHQPGEGALINLKEGFFGEDQIILAQKLRGKGTLIQSTLLDILNSLGPSR